MAGIKKPNETEGYAMVVYESLAAIFGDEEDVPQLHLDLDAIDATKFFTGMIIGCGLFYNKLTSDGKDTLSFTHLANQLIVQHLLESMR